MPNYQLTITDNVYTSMSSGHGQRTQRLYDLQAEITWDNGEKQTVDFLLSRGRLLEPREKLKADIEARPLAQALRRIACGLPYCERPAFYKRIKNETKRA